ncbi:DUF881 domain-containing protein [Alkaliphilus peptidifermentans]|uniref:Uncharacterized conserved protein YlxW, UPF0749 family n=1 Tax=Alkaliphilus peptidifermentans DSM 18978 TaxID=1120976 RepID=A0A1G5KEB2_9FIRM|nr:DUF881 domain-containing protein [Alkaliphilus peptidifermentans]SCY98370.1 Uncharacterized conserved protein YlxW, UPF0749 family [Alkaliphilus peptidifermentans DSM 18978]
MKIQQKNIVMGALLLILGLIIAMQFQTVRSTTGEGLLSTQKAQQMMKQLEYLRAESQSLKEEIRILENEILSYELSEASESYLIKNLQEELKKYQSIAGMRSLEGPGIVVSISDPQNEPIYYGHYDSYLYLIDIINILNGAGADAITINDQRVLATTEILPTSRNIIINSVPVTPPIHVAAIGDAKALETALNIDYGVLHEIDKNTNLQVNIKREANIIVPRYNKVQGFEYAKPVEASN